MKPGTKKHLKGRHNKTKKIYAVENIIPYNIHKATILSYDPYASCMTLKQIFGNEMGEIESPPDKALSKRNSKWMRFKYGSRAELHFVEPYNLKHSKLLKTMVEEEEHQSPLDTQLFENHIGIYVPDLTNIVLNTLTTRVPCIVTMREDGLYQLYIDIPYALDYLEVDSLTLDMDKVNKQFPSFKIRCFAENSRYVSNLEKSYKGKYYRDPNHNGSPRIITIHEEMVTIKGRDTPKGKIWKVHGIVDKKGNAKIDFTPKGGPNLQALIASNKVTFEDGNVWKRDTKIKSL